MIHIEDGEIRLEGKPTELVNEAANCLKGAVNGFYTFYQKVENDKARARELTEKMMETAFEKVREGAFEEVNNIERIEDEPCSNNVPGL